jgi:hypothetical protein
MTGPSLILIGEFEIKKVMKHQDFDLIMSVLSSILHLGKNIRHIKKWWVGAIGFSLPKREKTPTLITTQLQGTIWNIPQLDVELKL